MRWILALMAVITSPPVLVALTAQPDSNQNSRFIGAQHIVEIGANLYCGLVESSDGNPPFHFQAYKSTDQGATWTRMDAANESTTGSSPIYVAVAASDGIYFVWNDSTVDPQGSALSYARFDPSTDAWGPTVRSPDSLTSGAFQTIARRSNGDIVVFYQTQLTGAMGAHDVHYGIFSHAGAWLGDNDFHISAIDVYPAACVAQSDDTIHVLVNPVIAPYAISYQTLSPANAVSGSAAVATIGDSMEAGLPQIWNDRLIFPYGDLGAQNNHMFVGTPVAAPVWSNLTLPLSAAHGQWPIAWITAANALVVFQTFVGNVNNPLQLWYTPWDGAVFGASVLYYDALVLAPVGGAVRDLLIVSLVNTAAGISGIVAMQPDNGLFPPENTYFFAPPSAGPCSTTITFSIVVGPPTYWNPGSSESLLCEKYYPWSVPPKDRIPVLVKNTVPAPAANMLTELWSYEVPDGFWFVYDHLLFFATVAGYIQGSGSLIFTLDVNTPTVGPALPVGRPLAQFTTNVGELGEMVQVAPVQLYQGDILRAKVNIVDNTLGVGLPNVIHAAVEGWLFPHSRNI